MLARSDEKDVEPVHLAGVALDLQSREEKLGGHPGFGNLVELAFSVHRNHARCVDRAFEPAERLYESGHSLVEIKPVEIDGLVFRKPMSFIVLQSAQVIEGNFRLG